MKHTKSLLLAITLNFLPLGGIEGAFAQIGAPWIHDPATLAQCDGKWYTFGTGGGGIVTDDGWSWHSGPVRPGGGAAPDVIKIGDRYLIAYSATGGGLGGGHNGRVLTMWNKTLDPASPLFKYTEPVEVAQSDGDEDCDAIDAGLLLAPDGRLWLSYGTYFGNIRIVELDPKTGHRLDGNIAKDIAIDCEATDLIYHDGYYYLLGTHGTCCDGVNSTYNIVCGRSKSPTGPYIDNVGRDMFQGGGKMVISGEKRAVGAGHFGRTIIDEGVEITSFHWEADLDRSGRSCLAIRPLIWRKGWPEAGNHALADIATKHISPLSGEGPARWGRSGMGQGGEASFAIISERRGYSLELAVDFIRMQQERQGWHRIDPNEPTKPIPNQTLDEVQAAWSTGNIRTRINEYMGRPHQTWTFTAVPEAGGYLSNPYFKITITGTDRALCAAEDSEVTTVPHYTGDDTQLWRIEMLTDGTYRIMPKRLPGATKDNTDIVLYSIGDSTPTLAKYDFNSDNSKWQLKREQ